MFLKKLLLFSFISFSKSESKVSYRESYLSLDKEKEICNILDLHTYIVDKLNKIKMINIYQFDKNFIIHEPDFDYKYDKDFYYFQMEEGDKVIYITNNSVDNGNPYEVLNKLCKSKIGWVKFIKEKKDASIYKIKKTTINFSKKKYIYSFESIKDEENNICSFCENEFIKKIKNNDCEFSNGDYSSGEKDKLCSCKNMKKNHKNNNLLLSTIKDFFISSLYRVKKYNNIEVLQNFYETLLMFEEFLRKLDKTINTFSKEDKKLFQLLINEPSDKNLNNFNKRKIPPIKIGKKEINKNITDEDFNKIFDKIINKIQYIISKKNKNKGVTSIQFIYFLNETFNSISGNKHSIQVPFVDYIHNDINPLVFNPTQTQVTFILNKKYIKYVFFTFNKEDMENYKKFIMDWYEKFNNNPIKKNFHEHRYEIVNMPIRNNN